MDSSDPIDDLDGCAEGVTYALLLLPVAVFSAIALLVWAVSRG